jgi:periplasmic protein TonB
MNTQPNVMVSVFIAMSIHVAIACIVMRKSSVEVVPFAETGQGVEIKLDRHAYQNILQKQQEKEQKELVKKEASEQGKPKKPIVKKQIKIKAIQQKAIIEIAKSEMVAYKVQEQPAEQVISVKEAEVVVMKEASNMASATDEPTQVEQINAQQKSIEGVGGKANQTPLEMNDSTKQYLAQLMQHLKRYKYYPVLLKKNHVEGKPVIRFSINKSGHVTLVEVKRHTKYAELDQAAMEVFRRASPLPKIPSELERETLTMSLPIEYSLIND